MFAYFLKLTIKTLLFLTLHYLGTQNAFPDQLEPELTISGSPTLIARVHARADAYGSKYKYIICEG